MEIIFRIKIELRNIAVCSAEMESINITHNQQHFNHALCSQLDGRLHKTNVQCANLWCCWLTEGISIPASKAIQLLSCTASALLTNGLYARSLFQPVVPSSASLHIELIFKMVFRFLGWSTKASLLNEVFSKDNMKSKKERVLWKQTTIAMVA